MKIINSDKRYKHFMQGYTVIAQFAWASLEDKAKFLSIVTGLKEMHGEQFLEIENNSNEKPYSIWSRRVRNPNYIIEQNKSAKRRRIYLKNETDITMALLKT